MKCKNCENEIVNLIKSIRGNFCSKVCRTRNSCKEFYYRNHEQQKARVLSNYFKYIKDPEKKKQIRKINLKANAIRRFSVADRDEILSKFNYKCVYCLKQFTRNKLVIHHLDKQGRGNKNPNNKKDNLVPTCHSCHSYIHLHNVELKMKI